MKYSARNFLVAFVALAGSATIASAQSEATATKANPTTVTPDVFGQYPVKSATVRLGKLYLTSVATPQPAYFPTGVFINSSGQTLWIEDGTITNFSVAPVAEKIPVKSMRVTSDGILELETTKYGILKLTGMFGNKGRKDLLTLSNGRPTRFLIAEASPVGH